MKRYALIALAVTACLGMASCGSRGKTTSTTTTTVTQTSQTDQLTALQNAYENGVITEEEYNRKRQELLNPS